MALQMTQSLGEYGMAGSVLKCKHKKSKATLTTSGPAEGSSAWRKRLMKTLVREREGEVIRSFHGDRILLLAVGQERLNGRRGGDGGTAFPRQGTWNTDAEQLVYGCLYQITI